MELYGRYFDSEVRGAERFPSSGPALLVGNHSGPNCDPDTPALMAAWYGKNGVGTPLVVLSYDAIFAVPGAGAVFRRLKAKKLCSSTLEASKTSRAHGPNAIASCSPAAKGSSSWRSERASRCTQS